MTMSRISGIVAAIVAAVLFTCDAMAQGAGGVEHVARPISGTWINLPYKDGRNKFTNPEGFDNTDPDLWKTKVRELADMGIEYLVIMEVANEGMSYYPSKLMEPLYDSALQSPVAAILEEASRHGQKVFLSTGWAKNQLDDMRDPAVKQRQLDIMEELAGLYKDEMAFYGWYLPVEDCMCPLLPEHAVGAVNALVDRSRALTPGKKTMISPYGMYQSDFDDERFAERIERLKIDIIAYQDEVGCVRETFPLPRVKQNWKRLREIHDRTGIEMWANCETFTWEDEKTNCWVSALVPAAYPRLLSQQIAATAGGVERIISFMFGGIIENPDSPYHLGQAQHSAQLYRDYTSWLAGDRYWKLMEAAIAGRLRNNIPSATTDAPPALTDGLLAEECASDSAWQAFPAGYNEVVYDFGKSVCIDDVLVRNLNYHKGGIEPLMKTYLYYSSDGKTYRLASIRNTLHCPNNLHDAWVDGVYFDNLGVNARYLKVAFSGVSDVFIDEIFINPSVEAL